MDDLEAIRQRKLRELQARQEQDQGQEEAQRAQEEAVERILQQALDNEARERLERIRMSRPDFAANVIRQLISLASSGRLQRRLTDADLKAILAQLQQPDRDINITRK